MANDSAGGLGDLVTPFLGTPQCSPLVGRRSLGSPCDCTDGDPDRGGAYDCTHCYGSGFVAPVCSTCGEQGHETCTRRTLADLIQERGELLREMRAAGNDVETRETLRAQVAVLDAEIADLRRSGRAA